MQEIRSSSLIKPGYIRVAGRCSRCGGAGGSAAWAFTGWTCYQCRGSGAQPGGYREYAYPAAWTDEQVAEHVAGRVAKAEAKATVKAAKEAAEHAAWLATQPAALVALIEHRDEYTDPFIADVLRQATYKALSERQVEAVLAAAERYAVRKAQEDAELAAAQPLPIGSVEIEGTVLTLKSQPNYFGPGSTLKMLVKGQGWKVWGTCPAGLNATAGDTVRFTASVEGSDDDPTFGFYKRPRKARIL